MIQSSTFKFLKELKANNNRAWFDAHKDEYKKALENFSGLVGMFILELSKLDQNLNGLEPKDCIFRIYRDVRFSKDKSPFKPNFGAVFAKGGRKSEHACFYLHLESGNKSILAGGMYMPQPKVLSAVRNAISHDAAAIKKIISRADFKKYFSVIEGEKLKTAPKGIDKMHPDIELLKLKSYLMVHALSDKEVTSDDAFKKSSQIFRAMKPLNDYLNSVLNVS